MYRSIGIFFPIGARLTNKDLIEKLVRCFILLLGLLCPAFFTGCRGSPEGLCYYDQQCSQNWERTLHVFMHIWFLSNSLQMTKYNLQESFSSSSMWVPVTKLKSSGLAARAFRTMTSHQPKSISMDRKDIQSL